MTKVDIISGFLGAGKTTFIKELISKVFKDEKIVLIENEFGEIGIDSRFMQNAGIEVTEMNSGCICCTLVGDFAKSLKQVVETYAPDRIIIEPSGVGKLSDVVGAIRGVLSETVVLGSLITVADATKCKLYMKNFGEFYNDQIEHAGAIVLSRTGGMNEDKLAKAAASDSGFAPVSAAAVSATLAAVTRPVPKQRSSVPLIQGKERTGSSSPSVI